MLTEFMRQQEGKVSKEQEEAEMYEWGKGTVQKKDMIARAEELKELESEPFARFLLLLRAFQNFLFGFIKLSKSVTSYIYMF